MSIDPKSIEELKKYFEDNEFIYVVYSEYGCKVGISKNPIQRFEQIRLGLPSQKAMLIGLYEGKNSSSFEGKLHRQLKNRKISGEWFVLSQSALDNIDNFLLTNGFYRLVKLSILWANYFIPSIYLNGHIKIIEVDKESHSRKNIFDFPKAFSEIITKPTDDNIKNNNYEYLNSTEICERINKLGYNFTPVEIGKYLRSRGFKQISKRIQNVGVRKVYEICLEINAT